MPSKERQTIVRRLILCAILFASLAASIAASSEGRPDVTKRGDVRQLHAFPGDVVNFVGIPLSCIYPGGTTLISQVTCTNPTWKNRYYVEFLANRIIVRRDDGLIVFTRSR